MARKLSKAKYDHIAKTVGRLIRMFHYVLNVDKKSYRVCWFKREDDPTRVDIYTTISTLEDKRLEACVQFLGLFLSGVVLCWHFVTSDHQWLKGWEGHTEEELRA
jgi:hypothetical protein